MQVGFQQNSSMFQFEIPIQQKILQMFQFSRSLCRYSNSVENCVDVPIQQKFVQMFQFSRSLCRCSNSVEVCVDVPIQYVVMCVDVPFQYVVMCVDVPIQQKCKWYSEFVAQYKVEQRNLCLIFFKMICTLKIKNIYTNIFVFMSKTTNSM